MAYREMRDKGGKRVKYILSLTDKNPQNNMVIECEDEEEMNKYYKMAKQQGYKVVVKEVTE